MNFDNEKKQALAKLDKSKKGHIDEQIIPLINAINNHPDFYSTSSCAGRILLIIPRKKKYDAKWLFFSHEPISYEELRPYLEDLPEETVWFRMEPPIIHICAKNLDAADELLKKANESGFRRSGIISFNKRVIIDIMIPEKLDAPISVNAKLIADNNYLKVLIKHANTRLKKTRNKLKKLEQLFSN